MTPSQAPRPGHVAFRQMDPVGPDRLSQPVILSDQQDKSAATGDSRQTLRLGQGLRSAEAAIDDPAARGQTTGRPEYVRHAGRVCHKP